MSRYGGLGLIEGGLLQGRKFIIPAIVLVEKGTGATGHTEYAKACLIHHNFIADSGCTSCKAEVKKKKSADSQIGID